MHSDLLSLWALSCQEGYDPMLARNVRLNGRLFYRHPSQAILLGCAERVTAVIAVIVLTVNRSSLSKFMPVLKDWRPCCLPALNICL